MATAYALNLPALGGLRAAVNERQTYDRARSAARDDYREACRRVHRARSHFPRPLISQSEAAALLLEAAAALEAAEGLALRRYLG